MDFDDKIIGLALPTQRHESGRRGRSMPVAAVLPHLAREAADPGYAGWLDPEAWIDPTLRARVKEAETIYARIAQATAALEALTNARHVLHGRMQAAADQGGFAGGGQPVVESPTFALSILDHDDDQGHRLELLVKEPVAGILQKANLGVALRDTGGKIWLAAARLNSGHVSADWWGEEDPRDRLRRYSLRILPA